MVFLIGEISNNNEISLLFDEISLLFLGWILQEHIGVAIKRDIAGSGIGSEGLHNTILEAVGEGIYGVDTNGLATFINSAGARMLGWQAEALLGKHIHNLTHHKHADGSPYPMNACPIYAALTDGEVHHRDNEVFWRKDGSSFPVEYTSTPIYEAGKLVGAVAVFWDISERLATERQLRSAIHEISQLKEQLLQENDYLRNAYIDEAHLGQMIGHSPAMQQIEQRIDVVAATTANVLIEGESGTGKELIANAIHQRSQRAGKPLIKVNCSSIPAELFESEFFGHVKGAFTGAIKNRTGRFELADGGTLFLDEIGEMPLEMQPKLLRAIQEGKIERVGEGVERKVDVRIIAATNRNLREKVQQRSFREDLYYRLNVFPIYAPALREREQDIPLLAQHFTNLFSREQRKRPVRLKERQLKQLQSYHWPGNIRELQNVIERGVILGGDGNLSFELNTALPSAQIDEDLSQSSKVLPQTEIDRLIKKNIQQALRLSGGRISGSNGAARLLGINPTTLTSRIKAMGIKRSNPYRS